MKMEGPLHLGRVTLLSVIVLMLSFTSLRAQDTPLVEFTDRVSSDSEAAHISLKWAGKGDALEYELQESLDSDFEKPTRIYLGGDEASFISGLTDGSYYYRVRAREAGTETWGPWSEPLEFVCVHHSLTSALVLVASGAVLFGLLVIFIVINARDLRRFDSSESSAEVESQHA